jgi:hypothetical protein
MARKVYWLSPLKDCDICHNPFGNIMIDGKTRQGPWGNLCERCHTVFGVGLGLGRGQKYEKQTDGKWLKIGG